MAEVVTSILLVCGTIVLSQLSPGPDVFYVFRTSLAQGFRRGFAVALGINFGFLIQSIIACTFGAWVLGQSWCRWLILGAACWLLFLAWRIFPKFGSGSGVSLGSDAVKNERYSALILSGFLCNILNPKCMLFILSLTTDALRSHSYLTWYLPTLIGCLFFSSLGGWALWSALLQWAPLRRTYLRYTHIVDAFFAVILVAFAVFLLVKLWVAEGSYLP